MLYICLAQCIVIIALVIFSFMERRDLYNRLMCRNLDEYSRNTAKETADEQHESAHMRAIKKWREGKTN